MQGATGLPGRNGVNGHNGLPGRDGRDGAKGEGHLDHVVLKKKRDQLERSLLNKETGNSARGKTKTAKMLALLR